MYRSTVLWALGVAALCLGCAADVGEDCNDGTGCMMGLYCHESGGPRACEMSTPDERAGICRVQKAIYEACVGFSSECTEGLSCQDGVCLPRSQPTQRWPCSDPPGPDAPFESNASTGH